MTKKKVQLVLDEQAQETLAKLVESTGAESMAHGIRDALGVYAGIHDMLTPGISLALVDRNKNELQELNVPSLTRVPVLRGEWKKP